MDSPADHHPIRVAIVDDQEGVHQMLDAFLAPAPDIEIVGAALDGAEGLRRVRELRPDVLILDERLGGRPSGREVAAAVRAELPAVAILAFTAYDDLHAYQELVRLGVPGYLRKGASRERVIEAVRLVAAGYTVRQVDPAAAAMAARLDALTPREFGVLVLVALGHTNQAIGAALGISPKTAEADVRRLMDALGAGNRTEAVTRAYECGLVVPGGFVAQALAGLADVAANTGLLG